MRREQKLAWMGAGAIGLLWLFTRSSPRGVPGDLRVTSRDLDALARMLVVEHATGEPAEKAQIVQVALNRARRTGAPPEMIVYPGTRAAKTGVQGGTWNGSSNYRAAYERASQSSKYPAALSFVKDVLAGKYPNRGFTAFVHPANMPAPPCASNRTSVDTFAGTKCLPDWGTPTRIGIAYFYA